MSCPTVDRYFRRRAIQRAAQAPDVSPDRIRAELEAQVVAFGAFDPWPAVILQRLRQLEAEVQDARTVDAPVVATRAA